MTQFAGKIALVTGGTSGMGLVVAKRLAQAGATVVICGRDHQKGHEAVQRSSAEGIKLSFVDCDVTQSDQVQLMIAKICDQYGRLDFAFNNAGLSAKHGRVGEASIDNWKQVFDVNVNGTFHCMKYELAAMEAQGGGVIVNNSSLAGVMAIPGQAAYSASKFAINGLTQSAAIEYAAGPAVIRVNAIAPGPIAGGMNSEENLAKNPEHTKRKIGATAMRRMGSPEEVAATVLYLFSDAASYVTGAVIPVDGGGAAGKF